MLQPDAQHVANDDLELQEVDSSLPTLLIVDDEEGLLDAYRHYLDPARETKARPKLRSSRRAGSQSEAELASASEVPRYNIFTATTGEDAIELLKRRYLAGGRIELGFFDMKMPGGIDGLETIRRVLAIDPEIFCVIVTAYQDKPLDELAKAFGPNRGDQWDYISKPFTGNEIVQKARNMTVAWRRRRMQEQREAILQSSVDEHEDAALVGARELAIANGQLRHKQGELEEALARLTATNARLHEQMEETARMEGELRMAHKLEAVGQLAAGIAHEISTPTQYISNNVDFLSDAFSDLQRVVSKYEEAYTARSDVAKLRGLLDLARDESQKVEVDFLLSEVPDSLEAVTSGIATISTIVAAMRDFAHPDRDHKELGDINRAIMSTLAVAHSEYRYVAKVETNLGELPMIPCLLGGLSQVFLNLLVNAAHALQDAHMDEDSGRICITTWVDEEAQLLMVSIADNGCGMARSIQDKIFDPFFTTQDVGRGTGQGLAIARDIIVAKHQGDLRVESSPGDGATFTISLPL